MKNSTKKIVLRVTRGNKRKVFRFTYMYQLDEALTILTDGGWELEDITIYD